jgi:hypothetical protein
VLFRKNRCYLMGLLRRILGIILRRIRLVMGIFRGRLSWLMQGLLLLVLSNYKMLKIKIYNWNKNKGKVTIET